MINFIKDKFGVTITFAITIVTILLYNRLSLGKEVEIVYPIIIALSFYSCYILVEMKKYISFNNSLKRVKKDASEALLSYNAQQHLIAEVIKQINLDHIRRISDLEISQKNWKLFISQWIHNLKTPITVMDMAIQKVKLDQCSSELAVDIIDEEQERIINSLNNILNIIRLDDFTKDYCPETVDLYGQLKEIINNSKNVFIYNKVFPDMKVTPETKVLSDIKWNKVMLEQIVSNAIKYSGSKNENKTVTFRVEISNDRTILYIEDQGIGIPDYDIDRIFEPFFTGQNGRTVKNSTGIGLFVAKTISDKLGHDISIYSNTGAGTTAKISYLTKM